MKRVECFDESKKEGKGMDLKAIAKAAVKMAFDWMEAKYATNWVAQKAFDFVEALITKAIDDGLVEHLMSRGALTLPEDEQPKGGW